MVDVCMYAVVGLGCVCLVCVRGWIHPQCCMQTAYIMITTVCNRLHGFDG